MLFLCKSGIKKRRKYGVFNNITSKVKFVSISVHVHQGKMFIIIFTILRYLGLHFMGFQCGNHTDIQTNRDQLRKPIHTDIKLQSF